MELLIFGLVVLWVLFIGIHILAFIAKNYKLDKLSKAIGGENFKDVSLNFTLISLAINSILTILLYIFAHNGMY